LPVVCETSAIGCHRFETKEKEDTANQAKGKDMCQDGSTQEIDVQASSNRTGKEDSMNVTSDWKVAHLRLLEKSTPFSEDL
jgi:hypothetical protein